MKDKRVENISKKDFESNNFHLNLLSEVSNDILDLKTKDDILNYTAEKTFDFTGDSIIFIFAYNTKTESLIPKGTFGVTSLVEKAKKASDKNKLESSIQLKKTSKKYKELISKPVINITKELQTLFFHNIPGKNYNELLQNLHINEVFVCNMYHEDELYGNIVVMLRKKQSISTSLLEVYIRMLSLALSSAGTKELIHKSQSEYEKVLDNMSEGVMANTSDGTITYINKALCMITGYSKEELINKNISVLMPDKEETDNIKKVIKAREKNISSTYQANIKNKDGYIISLLVSGSPLKDNDGNIIGSVGVSRNITHKKKTTALKKELEIIKRTTEHKQQFLANMSHEMLTPLNGIVGVLDMLSKNDFTEDQKELVNIIQQSSNHLLYLINNILEVSKLDKMQGEINLKNFWVYEMINKQVELFSASAKKMNLFVEVKPSQNIDYLIEADELKISQIVSNLLGNAIKFNKKGGEVTIAASVENTAGDNKILVFDIWDTGIGISEDRINSIFDRFTQADTSLTRTYDGMGLGLNICKQLVTLLKGRIGAENNKEQGCHFWFKIPIKLKRTQVLDKKKYHYLRKKYPLALIIDSKSTNQKILSLILSSHNVKSETVTTGKQALEIFDQNKHSIIFCDPYLPDIDIYNLKIQLQQKFGKTPPFIALAGKKELSNIIDYKANFMDDFLEKPYREKIFKSMLDKWIL
ncbi:MAG: ATP-binding protein [Bacteroidales bacterium]